MFAYLCWLCLSHLNHCYLPRSENNKYRRLPQPRSRLLQQRSHSAILASTSVCRIGHQPSYSSRHGQGLPPIRLFTRLLGLRQAFGVANYRAAEHLNKSQLDNWHRPHAYWIHPPFLWIKNDTQNLVRLHVWWNWPWIHRLNGFGAGWHRTTFDLQSCSNWIMQCFMGVPSQQNWSALFTLIYQLRV